MKKIQFLMLCLPLLLCSACSIFSSSGEENGVTFYDLGTIDEAFKRNDGLKMVKFSEAVRHTTPRSGAVNVASVSGQFSTKIALRTADNQIGYDEANRWAKPVTVMFTDYIYSYLEETGKDVHADAKPWRLEVDIYIFEYNVLLRQASLGIRWRILDPDAFKNGRFKVIAQGNDVIPSKRQPKGEKMNPGLAMGQCAFIFCEMVNQKIVAYESKNKQETN